MNIRSKYYENFINKNFRAFAVDMTKVEVYVYILISVKEAIFMNWRGIFMNKLSNLWIKKVNILIASN